MYAQTLEGDGRGRTERLNEIIGRELLPALRTEPGFCGALSLIDGETETVLLVVFWETGEEATRPLPPYFAALLAELVVTDPAAVHLSRVWEVGARA